MEGLTWQTIGTIISCVVALIGMLVGIFGMLRNQRMDDKSRTTDIVQLQTLLTAVQGQLDTVLKKLDQMNANYNALNVALEQLRGYYNTLDQKAREFERRLNTLEDVARDYLNGNKAQKD